MKKKILIGAIALITLVFAGYFVLWGRYYLSYNKYCTWENTSDYDDPSYVDADGFQYCVFYPTFLQFTGNLTVGNVLWDESNQDENPKARMIIWPNMDGSVEYGLTVYYPTWEEDSLHTTSYDFLMDEDGNCLYDDLSEEEEQVLEENEELIDTLYEKMRSQYHIGEN